MDTFLRQFEPLRNIFMILFISAHQTLAQACQRQEIYLSHGLDLLKLQEIHSLYESFQEYRKD